MQRASLFPGHAASAIFQHWLRIQRGDGVNMPGPLSTGATPAARYLSLPPSRPEPKAPPATGARRFSVEEKVMGELPKSGSLTGVHEARSISERLAVDAAAVR